MKKKIGIIGNLGNKGNEKNGQTIKTKTIIKALSEKYGDESLYVADTNRVVNKHINIISTIIRSFFSCDVIILIVCDFAIRWLAFPCFVLAKVFKRKIAYVLVGGWIEDFVLHHRLSCWALRRYDCIFAETRVSEAALNRLSFSNIYLLNNCKYLIAKDFYESGAESSIKLCTLSRIVPEKGVADVLEAIKYARGKTGINIILDIYGEIDSGYSQQFNELLKNYSNFSMYKGVVEPDQCSIVIGHYDALVFPTKVMTEGIPGTIIDAMFGGTPVIASRWNSCYEVVFDGFNGYSYDCTVEGLEEILCSASLKENLIKMRKNCIVNAKKYTPETALRPLFEFISNTKK